MIYALIYASLGLFWVAFLGFEFLGQTAPESGSGGLVARVPRGVSA